MPGPVTIAITGVPLWLLQEYLEQLQGRSAGDGWLHGDGWQARLTQIEDYQIGSIRVGQVRLELAGESEAVALALQKKLLRAGG